MTEFPEVVTHQALLLPPFLPLAGGRRRSTDSVGAHRSPPSLMNSPPTVPRNHIIRLMADHCRPGRQEYTHRNSAKTAALKALAKLHQPFCCNLAFTEGDRDQIPLWRSAGNFYLHPRLPRETERSEDGSL
jgi:hypothetical protein